MKVTKILSESGYVGLGKRALGYFYRNAIRPLLPENGAVRYAGVQISRDRKLGDASIPDFLAPFGMQDNPDYEATLIRGLRSHVRSGDKVVIVGGGEGVTVTLAAQMVGDAGSVTCYEGGEEYTKKVRRTADRNGVSDKITVHHAIVGKSIDVHGDDSLKSSELIAPAELPVCDVLELDCEGAEIIILEEMKISPRAIIVETHGLFGAPTAKVRQLLERRGYEVSDLGWAEPRRVEECKQHDVRILAGASRTPRAGDAV